MRECMQQVEDLLKAKIQCVWIETFEENEVLKNLKEILNSRVTGMNLMVWSHTEGMRQMPLTNVENAQEPDMQYAQPRNLFKFIKECQNDRGQRRENVFVLRDFHLLNDNHEVKRLLRDVKEYSGRNYNPIIVVSPVMSIPAEHEKLFTTVTFDVPNKAEIERMVVSMSKNIERAVKERGKDYEIPSNEEQRHLVDACVGLTYNEISDVFAKSLVKYKQLSLQAIMEEKIQLVRKSGVLDYIVPQYRMEDIGGNNVFKQWFYETVEAFSEDAKAFGVPMPKGYMAMGIPGTSKTMLAEAIANYFGWPLLTLDMSRVMNKLVGESEKKIDQAFRVAKACAPCVFLWDEVEKMLGGIKSSNQSDSGTTARVFAKCLQFLNEDNGVYVVMTSNDASQLPPEFNRAGRLDAKWYFSLPNTDDRREIFQIHFRKLGKTVDASVINAAADKAENYTGAEIRECAKVAVRKAFKRYKEDGNAEITAEDVIAAVKDVIPLYQSAREQIQSLEMYAHGRARNTSSEIGEAESDRQNSKLLEDMLELSGS